MEQRLEEHRNFLIERLDPDFGLIDRLRSSKTLTIEEVNRINQRETTTEDRNRKLIDCIIERRKAAEFISALKDNGQIHLVNYLNSDGVYRVKFDDDWPLSGEDVNILDVNRQHLVEHIDTNELCNDLIASKVLSMWQLQFIASKPTCFDKNVALLDILRKCSIRQHKATIESLNRTNQQHVATILSGGNDNSHPKRPEDGELFEFNFTTTDGVHSKGLQRHSETDYCDYLDSGKTPPILLILVKSPTTNGGVRDMDEHASESLSPIRSFASGSTEVDQRLFTGNAIGYMLDRRMKQQSMASPEAKAMTSPEAKGRTGQRCLCCVNAISSESMNLNVEKQSNEDQGHLNIPIDEDQGEDLITAVVGLGNIIEFEWSKPNPVSITWQQNFRKRTKNYFFIPFRVKGTVTSSYLAVEEGHWNVFTGMVRESFAKDESGWKRNSSRGELTVTKQFRYGQNNEATFRFLVLGDKSDGMYQHRFAKAFENYSSQDQFQNFARTVSTVIDSCLKTNFTQFAETYIGSTLKEF